MAFVLSSFLKKYFDQNVTADQISAYTSFRARSHRSRVRRFAKCPGGLSEAPDRIRAARLFGPARRSISSAGFVPSTNADGNALGVFATRRSMTLSLDGPALFKFVVI